MAFVKAHPQKAVFKAAAIEVRLEFRVDMLCVLLMPETRGGATLDAVLKAG